MRIFILLGLVGLSIATVTGESLADMMKKHKAENNVTDAVTTEKSEPEEVKLGQRFGEDYYSTSGDPRYEPQTAQDVAKSVFDLAHRIGGELLRTRSEKFEVFSPTSIAAALNIVLLGSNGETFNELMTALGYSKFLRLLTSPYKVHEEFGLMLEDLVNGDNAERPRPQYNWKSKFYSRYPYDFSEGEPDARTLDSSLHKVAVANGLFIQHGYTIRPDFLRVAQNTYHCELQNLDFVTYPQESARFINSWVNEKTFGLVPKLVGDTVDPDTRAIIANAVYFKAEWERHFIEGATGVRQFFPNGKEQPAINVQMMANGGRFPSYASRELDCEILGFPYKQNQSTMYIILPNNSNRQKLIDLQARLTADVLEDMISRMAVKTSVILMPKLHLDTQVNLRSAIMNLGVRSLFDPRVSDLSLIAGTEEPGQVEVVRAKSLNTAINANPAYSERMTEYNTNDYLIFSRLAEDASERRQKRQVKYKTESDKSTLTLKDLVINKRILKSYPNKNKKRTPRQADPSEQLKNLDRLRQATLKNPGLFADDILHRVNLIVNEKGTEAGAATAVTLNRSGPQVVFRVDGPFLLLIRHDPTRLPLFYATVFEPVNT